MNREVPIIKISDINLAAALLSADFDVRGIDTTNPKRVAFIFFESSELRASMDSYWSGDLLVDPKALANYRRELLTRIHEDKG